MQWDKKCKTKTAQELLLWGRLVLVCLPINLKFGSWRDKVEIAILNQAAAFGRGTQIVLYYIYEDNLPNSEILMQNFIIVSFRKDI
jgi:hypothetical protein